MWDKKATILQERAKHTDWTSEAARMFLENVSTDHKAMRWAANDETIPGIARFFNHAGAWNATRATALWEAVFSAKRPLGEIDWMASSEGQALGFSLDANLATEMDRKRKHPHVNPLAVAAKRQQLGVVRHLIKLGCKVGDGVHTLNPIVAYVRQNAWRSGTVNVALMKTLVDAGAPLTGGHAGPLFNVLNAQPSADTLPWLKALHTLGMPLWQQDPAASDTPLHVLAKQRFLSEKDALVWLDELPLTLESLEARNTSGKTPLDGAEAGVLEAFQLVHARLLAQARHGHADASAPRSPTSRARPRQRA